MREAVVDASVAVKWVFHEECNEAAAVLLDGRMLHAPGHWLSEATAAVLRAVRRGQFTVSEAQERLRTPSRAPVRGVPLDDLAPRGLAIAAAAGLTAYDGFYPALAERLRVPLISADRRLLRALSDARIADGLTLWVGDLA